MRLVPLAVAALVCAVLVAGCGGSSDQTLSVGNGETITVPSDVNGVYGELEAILDELPYQQWYKDCVVGEFKRDLSVKEAEALSELPESEREQKAMAVTAKAGAACEAKSKRPVVNPDASPDELDLLRAGTVPAMVELAESQGFSATQIACVQDRFENLPDNLLIKFRNGTEKAREVILIAIFKACAEVE